MLQLLLQLRRMLVAEALVVIPVNLYAQPVVVLRLMFVALATIIHRSPTVVHLLAILATNLATDHAALKNAGMTAAANVIAKRFATKANVSCNL